MRAELTKIWTVRSSLWTLLSTVALALALGCLIAVTWRDSLESARSFDPLFVSFYGLTLAQLPLVVFGALAVTAEHSTGTIHASLAAVPDRARFLAAKLAAVAVVAFAAAVLTVPATFAVTQALLGPHGVGIGADGALAATVGACAYLTLMCVFAAGVAAMLRRTALTLAVLLPLLFLGSQGLGNIPGVRAVTQFLPDQTGWVIMHLAGAQDDPRWARDYGPWTGLGLLALWAAAAVIGGYLVLRRRDA